MKRDKFIKILGVGAFGLGLFPTEVAAMSRKKTRYKTCKEAWEKLYGTIGKAYKTDAFSYVHPARKTPNVLLYGDSISIAYTSQVRKSLKGRATVIRLFKNGGSSGQFIPNMQKMNEAMFQPHLKRGWGFEWDVIHFNVGLHDLKHLKGKNLSNDGVLVSSIQVYKENLDKICKYLKALYPKAKLIFATTTPVPKNAKGRIQGDSLKYNNAALEVLANYPDIAMNDLYAFTMPHLKQWAKKPGDVHYNELGFNTQGKEVAEVIAKNI